MKSFIAQDRFFRPRSKSLDISESARRNRKDGNALLKLSDNQLKTANLSTSQRSPFFCYQPEEQRTRLCSICDNCVKRLSKLSNFFSNCFAMHKNKLINKIRFLKIVPGSLIIVAILVISSNLWNYEAPVVSLVAAAVGALCSAVVIYLDFSAQFTDGKRSCVASLWWGVLFAVFSFARFKTWSRDDRDTLADMLVATSTAVKCCCDLLDRFAGAVDFRSMLVARSEATMLMGYCACGATLVGAAEAGVDLLFVVLCCLLVLANLRMKSTLAFPYLLAFTCISGVAVYDNLGQEFNSYAVVCFHLRLFLPAAADFYFSPLSAVERWSCTFWMSLCRQMLLITLGSLTECLFCLLAFYVIFLHPEYELVIITPIVGVFGLLWLIAHFALLSCEISLARKLSECQDFYHKLPTTAGGTSIAHIMSNKGVRQLAVAAQQTVACALLSTLVFGAIAWRRENAAYPALLLLVVGVECLSFGRHRELAVKLGGTCTAYALITPTTSHTNINAPVTLLPADSIQKQNERATSLITALHRFFALYLIDNLGCDYSTSGVSYGMVDDKLRALFSKRTADGARYDTYVFYYSGLTSSDGAFLLAGGDSSVTPDHVIDVWHDSSPGHSRLLLVLDVQDPEPWLRAVSGVRTRAHVAVQACRCKSRDVVDAQVAVQVDSVDSDRGFTLQWVRWNADERRQWPADSALRPAYAVSRRWSDFALRAPACESQPGVCRPCLAFSAACSRRLHLVRVLGAPGRRYRRLKMRWFPPAALDTGHGFKLVRA